MAERRLHVERLARRGALSAALEAWDREVGPVSDADRAAARTAFDELDAPVVRSSSDADRG